jgi:hypothetical protein
MKSRKPEYKSGKLRTRTDTSSETVYLILGEPTKSLAKPLLARLHAIGAEILSITDLTSEIEMMWRLDAALSSFELHLPDGRTILQEQLLGVIALAPSVGDIKSIKEKEYLRAEKRAALLAWIFGLKCPVVNRFRPMFWISPRIPLPLWHRSLTKCGLPVIDEVLSNVPAELKAFAGKFRGDLNYSPLSSEQCYRVATADDFEGLSKLTQFCLINLRHHSPLVYAACIVDRNVFWNQSVPAVLINLQDRLVQFAVTAGLAILEVALLLIGDTPKVCSIEPFPKLERFGPDSCDAIANALLSVLRSDRSHCS